MECNLNIYILCKYRKAISANNYLAEIRKASKQIILVCFTGVVKFHSVPLDDMDLFGDNGDCVSIKSGHSNISNSSCCSLVHLIGNARESLGVESQVSRSRLKIN